MKGCELCGRAARMYCESDSASLCRDCDEKVHGANFLVAKHCRTLLCQVCQSSTPWKASGTKLSPAVSVCESCVAHKNRQQREGSSGSEGTGESEGPSDPESEDEDDETDESDFDHSGAEDEDEDDENQVVPWSGETQPPPPPPVVSSSSSEGDISSGFVGNGLGLKRRRDNTDLDSEDELGNSSSQGGYGGESGQFESKSTAIISSRKRIQRDLVTGGDSTSETVVRICSLRRDQGR